MITINADSLVQARELVRKKGIEAKAAALTQYRSYIMRLYRELLLITPQYSSDMVSNWDIETDLRPARNYVVWSEKELWTGGQHEALHEAGDEDGAFRSAYARGLARMRDITYYGQPAYFVNPTLLSIDSPLIVGPDGVQQLRDDAVVAAWMSISSYLQARFGA